MISVTLDTRRLTRELSDLEKKQLPFAMMKALNASALDMQKAQRGNIKDRFQLRREKFILNTVKIQRGNFATKTNLRAIVDIDPARDVLSKFEDGGTKTSRRSAGSVAIPVGATRNKSDLIPQFARPKAFNLRDTTSASDGMLGKGAKRGFLLQASNGRKLLLQRVGKRSKAFGSGLGRDPNLKLLWVMAKSARIPRRLGFGETANRTNMERFPVHFKEWLEKAMRTAR